MIGLSPLSAAHPLGFQPKWVRPSTGSYPRFSLAMDRSPGFASTACDSLAILKTRFRCGSLRSLTSPHAVTRWLILQKARRHTVRCSGRLRARGFRYCFTPLSGCFSPFPHGTGSLSVTGEYLALEGGPPCFPPGFTCPAVLRDCRGMPRRFRVRGSHPLRPAFPCRSAPASLCHRAPGSRPRGGAARNPRWESPWGSPTHRVWASALSLAATRAISVDFSSSGYLDVSVPRVVLAHPMDSGADGGA